MVVRESHVLRSARRVEDDVADLGRSIIRRAAEDATVDERSGPVTVRRVHGKPVWVATMMSALKSSQNLSSRCVGVVLSHKNSFIFRGLPWQQSTRRPAISNRISCGSPASHARQRSLVLRYVYW